jgi:hypothetical protein
MENFNSTGLDQLQCFMYGFIIAVILLVLGLVVLIWQNNKKQK